ncbi:P-loop NTPase fold protein [Nocardioides sp. CER19]|uniref:P-loop NTPase fold protein n=1 Tax=Nocardioides sp. CER19 TaxID=3038538 RepID=UPI002448A447|nr:P-loop NTPase fold protein [Nocardioides sp. CER19]MDH2413953.1 P-loop NTPase fold protein [Nocardioides sp. CER19]
MSSNSGQASVAVQLDPSDLIEDRELEAATDDRLAHTGIVDQLAALTTSVKTPANIALYGPWGSGKSGIANLLKGKIDKKGGVRFVRFDAFKYADVPLRRNFISAVATELECRQAKYHGDLYSGRTRTEIKVPAATVFRLLGVFALLLGALTAILAIIIGLYAWGQSVIGVQRGGFGTAFRALSKQVIVAGLVPASLLAALIALASKTFSVDRSIAKPESDEQFEALFKELVSDAGARRLVVFVDELDRCSPSEVVATLDTIRTFLGIERCVFVVAADQNVLEGALTRAAKQETPADDANPYYSTGSAYLDKVFQYQLSLPPLLNQSVSKYAASLVEHRGGLWADINREYVLSVLIPTHVASPRRVKHLLNTFSLAYRLAEERYRSGLLAEDPRVNAASVARLVCLRVEFPLFARHLEVEANLPDLVLRLMRNPDGELPSGTSDRAVELARSYALENAAPSTVLVENEPDESDTDDRADRTVKAHNKQLLNYLSRTRQVNGPSRDLIYMQSSGTVFGLDGELALAIEQAAEDADVDTLTRRVDSLDEATRTGVLQLLAHQVRTGSGLAGPNAARSFLLLTEAVPNLAADTVVDAVAEAICNLEDEVGGILDEDTVASAWALATAGSEKSAAALRRRVIASVTGAGTTPPDFLFSDAPLALEAAPHIVTEYLSSRIVGPTGPNTVARLFALGDDDLVQILATLQPRVVALATEAVRAHAEWTDAKRAAEAAPTVPATTGQPATAAAEPGPEPFNPRLVLDALSNESARRETPVQHRVLRILLAVDSMDARNAALALIGKTEPVEMGNLATNVLNATRFRVLSDWPAWLHGISPTAITTVHRQLITRLVAKAWNEKGDIATTRAALDALAPLIAELPNDAKPTLNPDVIELVEPVVTDDDEATERIDVLERAALFTAAGVLDYAQIMSAVAASLQDTLAADATEADSDEPLYRYVIEYGTQALRTSGDNLDPNQVRGILREAASSPWLDDLGRVAVPLELARASGQDHFTSDDLPTTQTIATVIDDYGRSAASAATLWIDLTEPGPEDLAVVYERLLAKGALSEEIADAAQVIHKNWTTDEHRDFLDRYLSAPDSDIPHGLALKTLGLANADDHMVADLLCRRFAKTTNNNQRQAVITLWRQANIQSNAARRRLVETIIYGLLDLHANNAGGNVSAAELALNSLLTVGMPLPQGVKGALGQRVRAAVKGTKSLESKALSVMPKLGYSTSTNLFGKAKRVNFDDR